MPVVPFRLLFLVLGLVALPWVPLRAQAPLCAVETVGQVACIAGRLCDCRLGRGSPATGLPDGFRWDCGILRPPCGDPRPATIDPYPGLLPDALSIERNTNTITTVTGDRNRTRVDTDDRPHAPRR